MNSIKRKALIIFLCCHTAVYASERIALYQRNVAIDNIKMLISKYALNDSYRFPIERRVTLPSGIAKIKMQQTYRGIPIWGSVITASLGAKESLKHLSGHFLKGIEKDIHSLKPAISAKEAMRKIQQHLGIKPQKFVHQSASLFIKQNALGQATLVYHVSLYKHFADKPSQIEGFVDAKSSKVIKLWEGLASAMVGTGPGGNQKTGLYRYGEQYEKLDLSVSGDECVMDSPRGFRVLNINHGQVLQPPFRFTCPENTHKAINGAYSPLNDAYFFTDITHRMYKEWFDEIPWTSFGTRIWVHYLSNYEQYHWINGDVVIGDGANSLFPQTSLDVLAHEISHSFIKRNTDISINEEPGALAEAFCDMAGEAAKYYLTQNNDWVFGANIIKNKAGIRFFKKPEDDGHSVSHYDNYSNQREPHYNAGIINKAFYLLSQKSRWHTKKAFSVFVLAAQVYWGRETDLNQAAHDAAQAAIDLNEDDKAVCQAFAEVGLSCAIYPPPGHEPIEIHNGEHLLNIDAALDEQRLFKVTLPHDATDLSIDMRTQDNGNPEEDADLYVAKDIIPTLNHFDCAPRLTGSNETCHFVVPKAGTYYILLNAATAYHRVKLSVNYLESGCHKTLKLKGLSAKKGEEHFYRYCPTQTHTKVFTHGGSGDVDLYVRRGRPPTTRYFDCRPINEGNEESCDLNEPGQYYIMLKAHEDYQGVSLTTKP